MARRRPTRRLTKIFIFDKPYLAQYSVIAGVDEVGVGPLAGPVVAAAVILPSTWRCSTLNDSKQMAIPERIAVCKMIKGVALAIGVGIVEAAEIDRINIRQAGFVAMRLALERLVLNPMHVLVDGFRLPHGPSSQTGIIGGDAKSAHIAAASVIAKVTRDTIMEEWHERFPVYGFKNHKGYGTPEHLSALERHGPCSIHRQSYAPVRLVKESFLALSRE